MNTANTMQRDDLVSLASLLDGDAHHTDHQATLRGLRGRVLWPLAALGSVIALWCAWAPLSGAVVAAGQVQAELGRKVVQHQEGGLVRELLVRQGQVVRRGDPLLVVGDVRNDAAFDLLRKQAGAERVRAERARAEMNLAADVAWPSDIDASSESRTRERELFDARRRTLQEQLAAMQAQMSGANARVAALSAQRDAAAQSARLARDELEINWPLAESGFIQKTRLIALERNAADLRSHVEATRGQIAEAQMQVSAMANAIAQARGAYQQRAADELTEASARLRELADRLRPTQDQLDRQVVRAPVDGTVMALRVSAPGTAVGPREPLLEIAPSNESLVIEVHVDPHDIEHLHAGAAAEVRLSAFDARKTPLLQASVRSVSPDAVTDTTTRRAWYVAQVEVPIAELSRHPQLRLQAGMPAEVFVTTPPRSLLAYLLEPLGLFAQRALREP